MDRKKFKELMRELIAIKQDEENLSKAFKKFEPDFNNISFGRYETLVLESLEEAMKDEHNWISYFLYDCLCGKDSKDRIKDKNGKVLSFSTLDELYSMIKRIDL